MMGAVIEDSVKNSFLVAKRPCRAPQGRSTLQRTDEIFRGKEHTKRDPREEGWERSAGLYRIDLRGGRQIERQDHASSTSRGRRRNKNYDRDSQAGSGNSPRTLEDTYLIRTTPAAKARAAARRLKKG